MPGRCVCAAREMRVKWLFQVPHNGLTVQHHFEQFAGDAAAFARSASAAGLAAGQVFWRRALSGPEADHAHARPAYRLRERPLPEYG